MLGRGIGGITRRCKAGLAAIGIDYATQAGHELPQLNAVRIPDGVDDVAVRKALLERFDIEIGAGLGAFKGKVWRIGLMGYGSRQKTSSSCSPRWNNCSPSSSIAASAVRPSPRRIPITSVDESLNIGQHIGACCQFGGQRCEAARVA